MATIGRAHPRSTVDIRHFMFENPDFSRVLKFRELGLLAIAECPSHKLTSKSYDQEHELLSSRSYKDWTVSILVS